MPLNLLRLVVVSVDRRFDKLGAIDRAEAVIVAIRTVAGRAFFHEFGSLGEKITQCFEEKKCSELAYPRD